MTAHTVASRKAKGRLGQQHIVDRLLQTFPTLSESDVKSLPMGMPGVDIWLSTNAYEKFPFAIESKACESLNIWSALKQAEQESRKGTPLLVFKRNRSEVYCALKFDDFLALFTERTTDVNQG